MNGSYLNDGFFSRLEALSIELRANLAGFFGGKHLVKAEQSRNTCVGICLSSVKSFKKYFSNRLESLQPI